MWCVLSPMCYMHHMIENEQAAQNDQTTLMHAICVNMKTKQIAGSIAACSNNASCHISAADMLLAMLCQTVHCLTKFVKDVPSCMQ